MFPFGRTIELSKVHTQLGQALKPIILFVEGTSPALFHERDGIEFGVLRELRIWYSLIGMLLSMGLEPFSCMAVCAVMGSV